MAITTNAPMPTGIIQEGAPLLLGLSCFFGSALRGDMLSFLHEICAHYPENRVKCQTTIFVQFDSWYNSIANEVE
jgi:hypothetical protein